MSIKSLFTNILYYFIIFLSFLASNLNAQLASFPGAKGYGAQATGGRGGIVVEVTNIKDSGFGSLRYAIETVKGARTIVFRVSGTIELKSRLKISNGDVTIAGQTAPGDGICLRNYEVEIASDNVIIRYLRFRLGDKYKVEEDAFNGKGHNNIIIDHCSMSWSVDETASFYDNQNFTMQYCIISESLYRSYHSKGEHGYGGIWGGQKASFHHNLLAHHTSRNPRFCGSRYTNKPSLERIDFINNVIYNWGFNSVYGGEGGSYNIVNNYYKAGPATKSGVRSRIIEPWADGGGNSQPAGVRGSYFIEGNFVNDFEDVTNNNWLGVASENYTKSDTLFTPSFEITDSPLDAFDSVITHAGASFPKRDTIDARVVYETLTGTAKFGNSFEDGRNGIIDTPEDVGGYPELLSVDPPKDTDHDGMPDYWEEENGLNPQNPNDRNDLAPDGYTMLETYLYKMLQEPITSVEDYFRKELPNQFRLFGNYPNPFNPSTIIKYFIPNSGNVTVSIFNIQGQFIASLVNNYQSAGFHFHQWNGHNQYGKSVSSGVYIAKIEFDNQIQTHKMLLAK